MEKEKVLYPHLQYDISYSQRLDVHWKYFTFIGILRTPQRYPRGKKLYPLYEEHLSQILLTLIGKQKHKEQVVKYLQEGEKKEGSYIEVREKNPQIEKILREAEERGIDIKHKEQVVKYLQEFPDIIDVLRKAVIVARKHFPETQIILDIYQDPEIEDRYLILNVRLEKYDESFIDKLGKAESEFINYLSNKKGWVQLTTDFGKSEK